MSRMIRKAILAAALVVVLAGCTTLSHLSGISFPSQAATRIPPLLDREKSVFVALPEDGGSASLWYVGSGRMAATAVADAFLKRGVSVYLSGTQMTNEDAVEAAARLKAGYAVRPVITWWEPHNKWLGLPSRLIIRVTITDVATARVIASDPIESHTPLASLTNAAPEVLLASPLSRYVDTLY